jgi:hypothetical protein
MARTSRVAVSCQLSVFSYQLSVFSFQPTETGQYHSATGVASYNAELSDTLN